MKTGTGLSSMATILAMAATLAVSSHSLPVHSCGLEPSVNGGFTISYPGSLEVAVAVAKARSDGLLPAASPDAMTNEVRLQHMLADLRRLQARLNKTRDRIPDGNAAPFSLVLVGPALWSHYRMESTHVEAHYHAGAPIDGEVVVLTHHTVLRVLLNGHLTVQKAMDLGLLVFSGSHTYTVQIAFETGLQLKS